MSSKHAFILSLLITILIFNLFYFSTLLEQPSRKIIFVSRVIDGDTIEAQDNTKLRLANINTPEKGENGHEQALSFLKDIENKSIEIEAIGMDKYSRVLARIYAPEYLNLEIVKKGLAKKFLVEESEIEEFAEAEKQAIEQEKGIWKRSPYFSCFSSEIKEKEEFVILKNTCKDIYLKDWSITDESRKKYKFESISFSIIKLYTKEGKDDKNNIFWNSKQDIWNNDRDTLYLFDNEGKIAHYNTYGY